MKIYLDTKDLINVFENSQPFSAEQLNEILRANGHELVLSFLSIIEISAPLLNRDAQTNVMRLLNSIEKFPIKYISKIFNFELKEAYNAFSEGREYRQISPFFNRFDYTIEDDGPPPTHDFINYPLSEIVFDLWVHSPTIFKRFITYTKKFRNIVSADRSLVKPPTLRENFVKTVGRALRQEKLSISLNLTTFANWVFDKSERCPSIRLGYEVYHKITKNIGDKIQYGDIPDFSHLNCIPYVDLATLDRRMCSYTAQASTKLGTDYHKKIYVKLEELIRTLTTSNTANETKHFKESS